MIALAVDSAADADAKQHLADILLSTPADSTERYRGYARSVNALIAFVLQTDADAEWFIAAGDDTEPDLNHTADEIAFQCADHFAMNKGSGSYRTFGVCQPTGDRYGEDEIHLGSRGSAYIDRVCGSAWIGREFARRMYGGNGPLWPGYFHNYVDEELMEIALKMGVLWQRRDLTQKHNHWARTAKSRADMPKFLERANDPAEWKKAKQLFEDRKRAGFPGHKPI